MTGFGRGVFKSTDGGATWALKNNGIELAEPFAWRLARDPRGALYLVVARRSEDGSFGNPGDGALYRSTDGGRKWRNVLSPDQHIYDVTIAPRDPKLLYAAGFESSAWRSTDSGETWRRIAGYDFKWGHRVIPDPTDAKQIYVTTFGGSVWHGPADKVAPPGMPTWQVRANDPPVVR